MMPKSQQEFEDAMLPLKAATHMATKGDLAEAMVEKQELETLRSALMALPDAQRRLIAMRFGLTTKTHTLEQAARRMGLPLDDAKRLEEQALQMLRKEMLK